MKKIFSSLMATLLSCSMMFSFISTASAMDGYEIETSVNPKFTGEYEFIDSGMAYFAFKISSEGTYGVTETTFLDKPALGGTTASGFSALGLEFDLNTNVINSLFDSVEFYANKGQANPINEGTAMAYAFATDDALSFAQNDETLFYVIGTMKSGVTEQQIKEANIVKDFTKIQAVTSMGTVANRKYTQTTKTGYEYPTSTTVDYNTIRAEFKYTAPAKPELEPNVAKAGADYADGDKSFSTYFEFAADSVDGLRISNNGKSRDYKLPSEDILGEGFTKLIAIVKYSKDITTQFTLQLLNGEATVGDAVPYQAQ